MTTHNDPSLTFAACNNVQSFVNRARIITSWETNDESVDPNDFAGHGIPVNAKANVTFR